VRASWISLFQLSRKSWGSINTSCRDRGIDGFRNLIRVYTGASSQESSMQPQSEVGRRLGTEFTANKRKGSLVFWERGKGRGRKSSPATRSLDPRTNIKA
jgi:hypothetical protein